MIPDPITQVVDIATIIPIDSDGHRMLLKKRLVVNVEFNTRLCFGYVMAD